MRIVQIVYSVESSGRAALRLHKGFSEVDIHSSIITLLPGSQADKNIHQMGKRAYFVGKAEYKIQNFLTRNTNKKLGLFTYPVLGADLAKLKIIKQADVIYLHWFLWGLLNLNHIEKLARLRKPIVIIMHDMWSITGGCHHSFDCEKYKTKCESCPVFKGKSFLDLAKSGFNKKNKLYTKYKNLFFVSPSKWLMDCTRHSFLTKDKQVYYIPNVIDSKKFKPLDKVFAKKVFNLKENTKVVVFGAVAVDSPYKGWAYLKQALEILYKDSDFKDLSVIIFGSGGDEEMARSIPFETTFLGFMKDEYSMILVYNAADVFVAPSLADNQPTTVMESLCCGTPVVGFHVGGIPDMIDHKINGYLAKYKDAADLADGIKYCINNNLKGEILPHFQKEQVLSDHLQLIDNILK